MQFSEVKTKLDVLAGTLRELRVRLDDIRLTITGVGDELDLLPTKYKELITDVTGLADGSQDPAFLTAKSELDHLVEEYLATKTQVDVVVAALK